MIDWFLYALFHIAPFRWAPVSYKDRILPFFNPNRFTSRYLSPPYSYAHLLFPIDLR